MTTIIGFGHRSRSGKDTAAATIIKRFGLPVCHATQAKFVDGMDQGNLMQGTGIVEGIDVRRYAFADALKREVNAAAVAAGGMKNLIEGGVPSYGMLPDWVKFDPNAPMDDPLCPMGKQRTLLQWWGTEYRRNQDEDYWVKQLVYTVSCEMPEFALVTDFRFPNEAKALTYKVKVDRNVLVNDHPSEHALDDFAGWDATIPNDSTLEQFQERVLTTFQFIRDYVAGRTSYLQSVQTEWQ